jgi:putative PIN family toxin of toxin-antitoxin system
MKAKMQIVIDTNVWISGVLLKTGTPALLIQQVLHHAQPIFTQATFAELEERLWRSKFDRYLSIEQRNRLLHDIKAIGLWVEIPAKITEQAFCRDVDDNKFIHVALMTHAPYLVTGDKDLLVLANDFFSLNLQIITPAQALHLKEFKLSFQ